VAEARLRRGRVKRRISETDVLGVMITNGLNCYEERRNFCA